MKLIQYNANNSGGRWWHTEEMLDKLEAAGWKLGRFDISKMRVVARDGTLYLGITATYARKHFNSVEEAKDEFEAITGMYTDGKGCACCGPPHYFHEVEEEE